MRTSHERAGSEIRPRVVAVIPARGGSKGIPGKNLRAVGGIPLIARTVLAAARAERVDLVVVSSDDPAILVVAAEAGARALRRPAELSTDEASSESALLHALDVLASEDVEPELLVLLQCTSPFTTASDIDALVAALDDRTKDAALTVSSNHAFIWRCGPEGAGVGVNHDPGQQRVRRQDLEPEYRENGAGYAMRVAAFRRTGRRFCGPVALVQTEQPHVEIDEPDDLAIVDMIARRRERPQLDAAASARVRLLVTDFDGVHTDDTVYVTDDGHESVRCSRSDGLGVSMLLEAGIGLLILSREENAVVARRAAKLRCPVLHGVGDKRAILQAYIEERGIAWSEVAYLGNDANDLSCLLAAGVPLAPADAHPVVRHAVVLLARAGGHGAVREACDLLLAARGQAHRSPEPTM